MYEVAGDGPAVVLVHGITENRHSFDPLVGALAADHRVVAVDLRGHGASERRPPYDALTMAADLHVAVRAAGATDPLMVGHSLGGVVVSLYAASYPGRGVINIDQALALGGFKAILASVEPQLRGDDAAFRSIVDAMFDGFYGPLPDPERARLEALRRPDREVVLGVWDLVLTSDPEELDALVGASAAAITAPYLALHGIDPGDEYTTWLHAQLPSATVEVWADHGHYPHLVDPERFLARLREFERSC